MPDMSIRKFTDEQYTLIKAHADRERQSMETWVKNLILQKVVNPPTRLSPKAKEAWIKQRDKWMRAAAEMREAELEMQRLVMAPLPAPEAVEYMGTCRGGSGYHLHLYQRRVCRIHNRARNRFSFRGNDVGTGYGSIVCPHGLVG